MFCLSQSFQWLTILNLDYCSWKETLVSQFFSRLKKKTNSTDIYMWKILPLGEIDWHRIEHRLRVLQICLQTRWKLCNTRWKVTNETAKFSSPHLVLSLYYERAALSVSFFFQRLSFMCVCIFFSLSCHYFYVLLLLYVCIFFPSFFFSAWLLCGSCSLLLFVQLLSFSPLELYGKIANHISYFKHILHPTVAAAAAAETTLYHHQM